jgi:hypothetical protein
MTERRINQELYDQASLSMSKEDLDAYEAMGKRMYEDNAFETDVDAKQSLAVAYVHEALKSGMHPSYLDEDETALMQTTFGPNWFTRYGYDSVEELDTELA